MKTKHKIAKLLPISIQKKMSALAKQASEYAHSPYSNFKVGCSLITKQKKIFSGCNIENASYGGTVCAERVAIWKAVSSSKKTQVEHLFVYTNNKNPWPPCGFCRQVMSEFMTESGLIYLVNNQGVKKIFTLSELLPENFSFQNML